MTPTSEAQYRAAVGGDLPDPEQISPGIWSVPMPMPGGFLNYNLSVVHLDGGGGAVIMDPGSAVEGSLDRLAAFLGSVGSSVERITDVVLTHSHLDHIGLAPAIRERSGARLHLHEEEQRSIDATVRPTDQVGAQLVAWGVSEDRAARLVGELPPPSDDAPARVVADVLVTDGQALDLPGRRWRALWTPGHTPGHICIIDEAAPLLFTGDHILPTVYPGIGLGRQQSPQNPVAAYLASLDKLEPYDDREVIPGHGYRFRGLRQRREASRAHVLRRAREVAGVVRSHPEATTYEVAARLTWTGGWQQVEGSVMLMLALTQTEQYRDLASTSPELLA
jgi:glyoxylase-like metal-dependent hydrolase (beta-lactamase superfamily II)